MRIVQSYKRVGMMWCHAVVLVVQHIYCDEKENVLAKVHESKRIFRGKERDRGYVNLS